MNSENLIQNWRKHLEDWNSNSPYKIPLDEKIKTVKLVYYIPFGLPITGGGGIVNIGTEKINVETEVKQKSPVSSKEDDKIPIPAVGGSSAMRLWNDRFGQLNYTGIRFSFTLIEGNSLADLPAEDFVNRSVKAVNRILDSCRIISERFIPRNFTRTDIVAYLIDYLDSNNNVIHHDNGFIGGGKNMSNQLFDKSQLDRFTQILTNNEKLSLERELILNAQDYFLFENYRMTCIEIQSAVEFEISNKIQSHFQNKLSEEELEEILQSSWNKQKRKHLREATDQQITDSDECKNWRKDCAGLRHRVIHGKYTPKQIEAEKAINAGKAFIDLLNKY